MQYRHPAHSLPDEDTAGILTYSLILEEEASRGRPLWIQTRRLKSRGVLREQCRRTVAFGAADALKPGFQRETTVSIFDEIIFAMRRGSVKSSSVPNRSLLEEDVVVDEGVDADRRAGETPIGMAEG